MTNVDPIGVRFVLVDLDSYLSGTARATRATDQMGQSFQKAGQQASSGSAGVNKMSSSFRGVGSVAGGVLLANTISKLANMGAAAVKTGVNFDSLKQQATIAFTTMLGSGEKAEAFLDRLQEFAAKTPFEFPDLIIAAQRLVSVGVNANRVIPIMTTLGDATASMGTGALGIQRATLALQQMAQKGKVTGEEMLQLVEAGIPAWDALAAQIGTSVPEAQKRVEKGQVSVNELFKALETSAGPALQRVKGQMDAQSKTAAGVFSTIHDTFAQLSGTVLQPFFEQATAGMQQLADILSSDSVTRGAQAIAAAITKVTEAVGGFLDMIGAGPGDIAIFAGLLVTGLAAGFLAVGAAATAAFVAANAALFGIPIALAAVSAAVLIAARHWDELKDAIDSVVEEVPGPIKDLVSFIAGEVVTRVGAAIDAIISVFMGLVHGIKAIAYLVTGDWSKAWDEFKQLAGALAKSVVDIIVAEFGNLPNMLIDIVESAINGVLKGISKFPSFKIFGQELDPFAGRSTGIGDLIGQVDLSSLKLPTNGPNLGGLGDAFNSIKDTASGLFDVGDQAKKTNVDLGDSKDAFADTGAAAAGAAKKVDVLKDHIIDFDEALSHGLSAAEAGATEALDQVIQAQHDADEKAFNFAKTLTKVAAAFELSAAAAEKMVLDLARTAKEAVDSAVSAVFSKPTQEVAKLQLDLARETLNKLQIDHLLQPQIDALAKQAKQIQDDTSKRVDQITKSAKERVDAIESEINRLRDAAKDEEQAIRSARVSAVVDQINKLRESFENRVLNAEQIRQRDAALAALNNQLGQAQNGPVSTPAGAAADALEKQKDAIQKQADDAVQALKDSSQAHVDALDADRQALQDRIDVEQRGIDQTQYQINLLQAQSDVWQKEIQAADQSLLTQAEQQAKAQELIGLTAQTSSELRNLSTTLGTDIIPEMDKARDAVHLMSEAAKSLTDNSIRAKLIPQFDAAAERAKLLAEAEDKATGGAGRLGDAADAAAKKIAGSGDMWQTMVGNVNNLITRFAGSGSSSSGGGLLGIARRAGGTGGSGFSNGSSGGGGGGGGGGSFADGGFVYGPTYGATLGESRSSVPEVVLPLGNPTRTRELLAQIPSSIAAAIGGGRGGGTSNVIGQLNVSGATLDQQEAAAIRAIQQVFRQQRTRSIRSGGLLASGTGNRTN